MARSTKQEMASLFVGAETNEDWCGALDVRHIKTCSKTYSKTRGGGAWQWLTALPGRPESCAL
eukprot:1859361-Rhodomonas_salina.1